MIESSFTSLEVSVTFFGSFCLFFWAQTKEKVKSPNTKAPIAHREVRDDKGRLIKDDFGKVGNPGKERPDVLEELEPVGPQPFVLVHY